MEESFNPVNTTSKLEPTTEIWAVGGGKGGTGKTFIICQLAIYLASSGKKIILIDTDFGGANVHSYLGVKKSALSLINFFESKEPLENLLLETDFENLKIIAGVHNAVSANSITYSQKLKFFRHIKKLRADFILLDLGGGTTFNTIDSFLLADKMLVVTIPEITATENLFHFIKNVYFRKLNHMLRQYGIKNKTKQIWTQRKDYGINGIVELIDYLVNHNDIIDQSLVQELNKFSLFIILNKVRNSSEILKGFSVKSICIKYLGVKTIYPGYISYDPQFWKGLSIIHTIPDFKVSPRTSSEIKRVANNIMKKEQIRIDSIKNG